MSLQRTLRADRYRLLGHRVCQGAVPRGLHPGHRDDALDTEDCGRVLAGSIERPPEGSDTVLVNLHHHDI